jgi:hypothetical protein
VNKLRLTVLIIAFFLAGAARASCPMTATCPIDGNALYNTYNCRYGNSGQTCLYEHTAYDPDKHRMVKHGFWIVCD